MSEFDNAQPSPAAAPAAPSSPAASAPAAPAHVAPATPQATPYAPAQATPAPAQQVEPSWLKGRLEETRNAALRQAQQHYAQQEAQHQARVTQMENQLRALVGASPPANPEVDAVRQQFAQLYPGLARMEEQSERLMGVLDRSGDLETQTNHYWQSYGRQTMNRLFEKANESLGSPLDEAGKRQLHAAFTGYVSQSPELTARYTNDPTLVDEFWNAFTSSFVNPARRATSASIMDRTAGPLPSDTPGGQPALSQVPKLDGLDQRTAAAWQQYQSLKK